MGYVQISAMIPDDEPWIAMYEITPDGEVRVVGYIKSTDFEKMVVTGANLHYKWNDRL